MSSVTKGILAAFVLCVLILMVSCQQCLVCNTVGDQCYRCRTSSFEGIYCEVDSAKMAQLMAQGCVLDSLTSPVEIEECSENKEQLSLLQAYYEDFNLDCRKK